MSALRFVGFFNDLRTSGVLGLCQKVVPISIDIFDDQSDFCLRLRYRTTHSVSKADNKRDAVSGRQGSILKSVVCAGSCENIDDEMVTRACCYSRGDSSCQLTGTGRTID